MNIKKTKRFAILLFLVYFIIVGLTLQNITAKADSKLLNTNIDKITKEDVIALIEEQGKDKQGSYYDELVYELVNVDDDKDLELVVKNTGGVHIGEFYIFKLKDNAFKLIAEENWNTESLNLSKPIELNGIKLYETIDSSGGTGADCNTAYLWYVDNGKFKIAWKHVLKDIQVFKENYYLKIGNYQFNNDNNLLYAWSSDYIYELDGITLKENKGNNTMIYKFDGNKFVMISESLGGVKSDQ
ncbi:hypothetical protein [Anaerovorax odorimutans]|uniref:hypothetical protein n=1 Tax=Anaerovorax odorimutans TaxID=109327 RepID=UPI00048479E1|nr:hypothetical protein [Anaerovorax odorimutans]